MSECQRLALAMMYEVCPSQIRNGSILQLLRQDEAVSVMERARDGYEPERAVLRGFVPLCAEWFVLVGGAIALHPGSARVLCAEYDQWSPYRTYPIPEPVSNREAEAMLALDDVLEDVLACDVPELRTAAILALRS